MKEINADKKKTNDSQYVVSDICGRTFSKILSLVFTNLLLQKEDHLKGSIFTRCYVWKYVFQMLMTSLQMFSLDRTNHMASLKWLGQRETY